MSSNTSVNYVKGVVICHGKSELAMVRYITSNLHLPIKSYAKDKGNHSIQITGLDAVLNSNPFSKLSSLASEYPVEIVGKGKNKKIANFKLFIIMDTDDCSEKTAEAYMSKSMFINHWLYEYIVPIYSIKTLEEVLVDAGIMAKRIKSNEKGTYYAKIFPINEKPLSDDTLHEVKTLRANILKSKKSNIAAFIDYCLSLLPY